MGSTERIIRSLIAIVFLALYFTGAVTGTLGIILVVAAVIFLATSAISWCPIWAMLGVNTTGKKKEVLSA